MIWFFGLVLLHKLAQETLPPLGHWERGQGTGWLRWLAGLGWVAGLGWAGLAGVGWAGLAGLAGWLAGLAGWAGPPAGRAGEDLDQYIETPCATE